MELFNKFIIEDDTLQMSKVTFHKDLVKDQEKVRGGGSFLLDNKLKEITFYGSSFDFGPADDDEIKKCVLNKKVFWALCKNISDEFKFKINTGSEILTIEV